MDLRSFDNFRPDSWQESGILMATARLTRHHWRSLRASEKWRTSAAATVIAGLLLVAAAQGPVHFDVLSPVNTAAVRSAVLSRTEPQFATEETTFEVSPKLWNTLIAYVDTWPDLPEEPLQPESEPFV